MKSLDYILIAIMLISGWVTGLDAAPSQVMFEKPINRVDTYDYIELTVRIDRPDVANPFTDASVQGSFGVKGQEPIDVDGFCDSKDGHIFRIRFMPVAAGKYDYNVTYHQGGFQRTDKGTFHVRDSGERGLLRVDEANPWHFIWEGTGEHYFWNGTTTYYLMGWKDDDTIRRAINRLADLKINRLRVLVYGRNKDRPWGQPVRSTDDFKLYLNPWPAQRPNDVEKPGFDLTRFNLAHWRKYERLLQHARTRDVIVSVIPFIGGQVLPTPFKAGSPEENLYYRYAVARFAAFSNMTWDLGNEHNFHRKVPNWANTLGPKVKEWDPYDHLTSAHNVVYRTDGNTWNDMQLIQRWDAGQNHFMLDQRQAQTQAGRIIPQVNEEYGYQDLWEKYPGQRAAETRRRLAWEIYMAGCYQTTGETANRGTGFNPDSGGGWVNGRGDHAMTMLKGYAHIVDFFTSFDWWRLEPHNKLVDGAFCLARPGRTYALYMSDSHPVTVQLQGGPYRARRFNPRNSVWTEIEGVTAGPWTSPEAPDDGDWAMLLEHADDTADRTSPRIISVRTAGDGRSVLVSFSEPLGIASATNVENYSIKGGIRIERIELHDDGTTAQLSTSQLSEDHEYLLTIRNICDRAPRANKSGSPENRRFRHAGPTRPIVELCFNETEGPTSVNTGTSSVKHKYVQMTQPVPRWTGNTARRGDTTVLDFGNRAGEFAADLQGGPVASLKGLKSLTISGWLNCRNTDTGPGGNRIVTTSNNGGEGFDLVFLQNGRLQIGINEWPDGVPAVSSPGRITVDAKAGKENWRFFSVTYDATATVQQVKFYFGDSAHQASLDSAIDYARGPVGRNLGPLTVGHFNPLTRPGHGDRIFRGLIDEIRIFGSTSDRTGAMSVDQIRQLQL